MSTILVPIDFSDTSINALHFAIDFFGVNAKYIVVHVVDADYRKTLRDMTDDYIKFAKEDMTRAIMPLEDKYGALNVEQRVHMGVVHTNVMEEAKAGEADYVVLGTTGKSGLEEFFMGSVSRDIISNSPIPAIAVPAKAKFGDMDNIVFAADYADISDTKQLNLLSNFCQRHDLKLDILHINTEDKELNADEMYQALKLDTQFNGVKHEFHTKDAQDIPETISAFIKDVEAEMVVTFAREHSFFDRLFKGSVSFETSKLSNVPLVIFHEKAK